MVLLDSAGRYSRIGDAERIRRWIDALPAVPHVAPGTATTARAVVPAIEERSATMTESERDLGRSGSDTF
jgi:serine-type D-Ala-D-Ala endopeptidase (penicillin-binding protein 7)